MKYKLLVLDVDGTLLSSDNSLSKQNLASVLKIQQMGIKVVLCSGRSTEGLQALAQALDLATHGGYLLSYNGGQIIEAATGRILFEKKMDTSSLRYLEKKAKEKQLGLFTYHQEQLLTTCPSNPHIQAEAQLNRLKLVHVNSLSEVEALSPYKCVLVGDDEDTLIHLKDHWRKRLAGVYDVYRSEPFFLEVVPEGVDKGNSLMVLLDKIKIAPENVMAIGDGRRDVSPIQLAGLGIAMGNAQDSVKVCADYVTASNDEDGVALAIQKFILAQIRPSAIPLDQLNASSKHALMGNLGIQYTYASDTRIEATMPVDKRTRQPFGILHGGATLALAETVAGLGSMIICNPNDIVVGMQVSGNHISSAHEGDTVRAVATIVHKGNSSHVWNVDVFTSTDKLISSIRVVNSVLKKK